MKRDWVGVGAAWLGLTAVGEVVATNVSFFPTQGAEEARVSDDAFRLLMQLSAPVFAAVVAMLVFTVVRFRARGTDAGDGPPMHGDRRVYVGWLGVTAALTAVLIINPGLVGLAEMRGKGEPDLIVKVEGRRWFWTATYPDGTRSTSELAVPVGARVLFEVTATDVVHSFWVPAFRVKIDAVPGRTTMVHATPTVEGFGGDDPAFRLQCAELCGFGHATMAMPVRVLSPEGFEAWLTTLRATGTVDKETCEPSEAGLSITAEKIAFDTHCLAAPEAEPFSIAFHNRESVPHNLSIAADEAFHDVLFTGDIFSGPGSRTYAVKALPAGQYYFRCDVHPIPAMSGSLVIS